VFTVIFTAEALAKIVAFGLKPYLSYFQNCVDGVIVIISLMFIFLESLDLEVVKVRSIHTHGQTVMLHRPQTLTWGRGGGRKLERRHLSSKATHPLHLPSHNRPPQALRVLRAIKPLRALTRSAGMQLIFKSLTLSLAAMGNVSVVVLLFFLIFAILGVQVWGTATIQEHTAQHHTKNLVCVLHHLLPPCGV
jgi:Ion transport protein